MIRIMDAAGKQLALGSGFVVSPSGVIVTNHHVIAPIAGGRLVVKLPNGDTYDDVWVIHAEERRDFAVLAIKASGLTTARLGDSDKVEVGEQVVALGSPQGLEQTFTVGIVSHIRPDPRRGIRRIQHQAPISKGSSGGPLFNMKGEVVGINTWSVEEGQNLNLAVPVNYVKAYLPDPPKMTYEQYARTRGAPPAGAEPAPVPPSAAWKTYRNDKYGFSFKYPQAWDTTKRTDSREDESGVSWFFQHAGVRRGPEDSYDSFKLTVRSLPGRKQNGQIDLVKAAETHFKSRYGAWKEEKTGFPVRPTEFIRGDGYAGYYFAHYPMAGKIFLFVSAAIYTKSFVYEISAICPHPPEHAEFQRAFAQVVRSFEFTEVRGAPPPPSIPLKTYRNEQYRLSFEYPGNWELKEWDSKAAEQFRQFGYRLKVYGEAKLDDSVPGTELGAKGNVYLTVGVEEAKESDFEKAARRDHEEKADSKLQSLVQQETVANEFLKGEGYSGNYWVYRNKDALSVKDIAHFRIRIYTKSFVYYLEGYYDTPSLESYYKSLIKKVFESFKFPT